LKTTQVVEIKTQIKEQGWDTFNGGTEGRFRGHRWGKKKTKATQKRSEGVRLFPQERTRPKRELKSEKGIMQRRKWTGNSTKNVFGAKLGTSELGKGGRH